MKRPLSIVVVEDHQALRELTVHALSQPDWRVRGFESAEALYEGIGTERIDVAVLDLNLPGEDGLSLARRLRERQATIGIAMLTVRDAIADKVTGYDHGADLYLPKPAASEELVAAVTALARRLVPPVDVSSTLVLDLASRTLRGPAQTVALQEAEASLLRAFALAPEGKLETWQVQEVLGEDKTSRTALEIRISRLRKKFAEAGSAGETLRAIRGQGYRLLVELSIT